VRNKNDDSDGRAKAELGGNALLPSRARDGNVISCAFRQNSTHNPERHVEQVNHSARLFLEF
jgi:hypothetical protein